MKVLKAIGAFFARIGRWIRDTAWVQPLLIVGGIFAIIFSIPYIVGAIQAQSEGSNPSEAYYANFKQSLNNAQEGTSKADELLYYIEDMRNGTATEEAKKKYGTKFFLTVVETGCANCESIQPGFQTLESKWGKDEFVPANADEKFKFYTIIADEATKDDLSGDETSFLKYFYKNEKHSKFFEIASSCLEDNNRPYWVSKGDGEGDTYQSNVAGINEEKLQAPTTFMIDFSSFEFNGNTVNYTNSFGICDILFNFKGKDNQETPVGLARTLMDCWNHAGVFASTAK